MGTIFSTRLYRRLAAFPGLLVATAAFGLLAGSTGAATLSLTPAELGTLSGSGSGGVQVLNDSGQVAVRDVLVSGHRAGSSGRVRAVNSQPVTLVTSNGTISAVGQDGPWLVWAADAPCVQQLKLRRLSGGPVHPLLSRKGVSCSRPYDANAFEHSIALAGTRAVWAVATSFGNTGAGVSIRTSSLAHPLDTELYGDDVAYESGPNDSYLPPRPIPYAGSGSTLLYAPLSNYNFLQVSRVDANGQAAALTRTEGTHALAASGAWYAAARDLPGGGGVDVSPAWSPDGRRILFERARAARAYDVFVVDADGSHERLLSSGVEDVTASWSPDGTRVLLTDDVSGRLGIVVVDLASGARTVLSGSADPYLEPSWSPDGSRIAYRRGRALYVSSPTGAAARRVAPAPVENFAWSPDGTRIAWASGEYGLPHAALYVTSLADSQTRKLRTGLAGYIDWSPDGTSVAWANSQYEDPTDGLYLSRADGSQTRKLHGGSVEAVSWSPDGTEIAFEVGDSQYDISVVRADGTGFRKLYRKDDGFADRLQWSPDGSRLAIGYWQSADIGQTVVIARKGSVIAELNDASHPAWSPDGKKLIYGGDGLGIASANGVPQQQRLTHPVATPAWNGVEVKNARTGATRLRVAVKGESRAVALTPTHLAILVIHGRTLARPRGTSRQILVYSLDGTLRHTVSVPKATADDITAAGPWAIFHTGKTIRALDLASGHTRTLTIAKTWPVGLSLKGTRLIWAETTNPSRIRALTLPR